MVDALHRQFLDYAARILQQHAARIESCLGKLNQEQVWARGGENENAIGNLVLHLCGNLRQWIVAGVGGSADTRNRDAEFDARGGVTIPELVERLRATVTEAVSVLAGVTSERLAERLAIQEYNVSGFEAIFHVVEHFAGHTGQILFATKLLTGEDLGFYRHLRQKAAHGEKTP